MYNGQSDKDMDRQQNYPYEYVASPGVTYDGSDPDRGFTEDTPDPSVAGGDDNYGHDNYEKPFVNGCHNFHIEVHREFWDIIDSEHECEVCQYFGTVMQCPACDLKACTYCKDTYG